MVFNDRWSFNAGDHFSKFDYCSVMSLHTDITVNLLVPSDVTANNVSL